MTYNLAQQLDLIADRGNKAIITFKDGTKEKCKPLFIDTGNSDIEDSIVVQLYYEDGTKSNWGIYLNSEIESIEELI